MRLLPSEDFCIQSLSLRISLENSATFVERNGPQRREALRESEAKAMDSGERLLHGRGLMPSVTADLETSDFKVESIQSLLAFSTPFNTNAFICNKGQF